MEVIVEFLEGDPDQPLVVGTVYNDEYKPPYDLPGDKNIAGWKSESTEGGGQEDYNELVFDDTKGSEKITIHAQYDMDTTVEHNDTLTVENNRDIKVTGTHTEVVNGIMTIESKQMIVLKVGFSTITIDAGSITLNSIAINIIGSGTITATAPLTSITGTTSLALATNVLIARLNGGTPVITI
jgi:type VI secretion system secreted protein VgrG